MNVPHKNKAQNKPKNHNKPEKVIKRIKKNFAKLTEANSNQLLRPEYLPTKINQFRATPRENLERSLASYHAHTRSRYLFGLCHPDVAVKEGIPVKLYSDVPIPTSSIGFHVQQQFTTNATGNFLATWRPSFMMTTEALTAAGVTQASNFTWNNQSTLTGNALSTGNNFVDMGYFPNVALQRYRLVSAMLKISYNGSVLNQAGTMLSCCTFDPLRVATGNTGAPITGYSDGLADRFGQFSVIANGLWNTSTNITKDSEGLECLYVPLDPDDLHFQRVGTYYGTNIGSPGPVSPDAEGAHIQYVVAGRNLPVSSACIIVDFYYNFEVIADPTTAPLLRSETNMSLTSEDHRDMMHQIGLTAKSTGFIHPTKPDKPSASWPDTIGKIIKLGATYIPKIFAMLS